MQTAVIAFAIAFVLTPLFRWISRRAGLLDVPNERSSHAIPTPRSGGKAMVIAMAIAIIAAIKVPMAIAASVPFVTLSGLVDDLRGMREWQKFLLQATAAIAFVVLFPVGNALLACIAVIWLIGFTNAFNFMDGINGIASLQAIVSGITLVVLAGRSDDVVTGTIALAIAAAAAGFLIWNLTGTIFMGDTGSATIGFLLAACAVRLGPHEFFRAVLPMLPFIFDTGLTLAMRMFRGEAWFRAHRSHLYQRLTDLGWSHLQVTALWTALAAIGGAAAIFAPEPFVPLAVLLAMHVALSSMILTRHARHAAAR